MIVNKTNLQGIHLTKHDKIPVLNNIVIEEDGSSVLNIPIIPSRGWSKSQDAGLDFDIWTRDRYGSSTSKKNVSTIFGISNSNSRFRASINGKEQEIDISDLLVLPSNFSGEIVASTIQSLFNQIPVGSNISSLSEPFILQDGDTLSISVDGGVNQDITFNASFLF